jgi:hypothetical protein
VVGCFALIVCSLSLATAQQSAANREKTVPNLIKFTGAVKDTLGIPKVGSLEIRFALYADREGGHALWSETQEVQTDSEGNYSVFLGASEKSGLPIEIFSTEKARWLGVQVQQEEEQQRVLFIAVPYALKAADAETVGGKSLSSFVLYEDLEKLDQTTTEQSSGSTAGNKATTSAIQLLGSVNRIGGGSGRSLEGSINGNGTANAIQKFMDATTLINSVMYEDGGNIGIGVRSPTAKLEVGGGVQIPNQNYFMTRSAGAVRHLFRYGTNSTMS